MSYDNNGNVRVDFAWGNMPPQPNDDRYGSQWLGDGESEYYFKGHDGLYVYSQDLDTAGWHEQLLKGRGNFPDFDPTVSQYTVGDGEWWNADYNGKPMFRIPNIIGKTKEEAFEDFRQCGVAEELLTDLLTDAEDPYTAGAWVEGIVLYRYMDPLEPIGQHWDGSPWLAGESNGKVMYTSWWPDALVPVGPEGGDEPGFLEFVVLQTEDPTKDSWSWWN